MRRIPGGAAALVVALAATPAWAQPKDPVTAAALFNSGRQAADAGDWPRACQLFTDSQRLDPAPGTLLNLALCEERTGKVASAWQHFQEVIDLVPPSDDRVPFARTHRDALVPRLPKLQLDKPTHDVAGLFVTRDGIEVTGSMFGTAFPIDPGTHVIVVTAPGRNERRIEVSLKDGERRRVQLEAGEAQAPKPMGGPPSADAGSSSTSADPLSHGGRWGAFVRADIDGKGRGAVLLPGVSYGIGDWLEVSGAGLVGRDQGAYFGGSAFFMRGSWKPRIDLGVPIFLSTGPYAGVQGAAGVQWDPSPTIGMFATLGATAFLSVPNAYDRVVFVPSVGAQTRL